LLTSCAQAAQEAAAQAGHPDYVEVFGGVSDAEADQALDDLLRACALVWADRHRASWGTDVRRAIERTYTDMVRRGVPWVDLVPDPQRAEAPGGEPEAEA
jgi:hypothetical protein